MRRVFFDTADASGGRASTNPCCVVMRFRSPRVISGWRPRTAKAVRPVEVTDLRLFLFANGIGILSIGVEAFNLPAAEALWINETLRKVYPSSGRQVREGRFPNRLALELERRGPGSPDRGEFREGGDDWYPAAAVEDDHRSAVLRRLPRQEYEPVLDERMIVYTYFALDHAGLPEGFLHSEDYQVLLSRFLYVDRGGEGYRYEPEFTRAQMERQIYRRWVHQGTYYGFTSYSNITATLGAFDCDEHQLREGFLIHRMFNTRYYLMALVALFYRATLLDFSERTALVSKQLYLDQEDNRFAVENIRLASDLRGDFLHFSNYWHFEELANKDEENEHFALQCREYSIHTMKAEIEEEIEKLNASLHNFYQFRNTEAVNRLAVLSMLLGAGAVVTGSSG